jgi:hypothetical protein
MVTCFNIYHVIFRPFVCTNLQSALLSITSYMNYIQICSNGAILLIFCTIGLYYVINYYPIFCMLL